MGRNEFGGTDQKSARAKTEDARPLRAGAPGSTIIETSEAYRLDSRWPVPVPVHRGCSAPTPVAARVCQWEERLSMEEFPAQNLSTWEEEERRDFPVWLEAMARHPGVVRRLALMLIQPAVERSRLLQEVCHRSGRRWFG
jgi:hypothetical protein